MGQAGDRPGGAGDARLNSYEAARVALQALRWALRNMTVYVLGDHDDVLQSHGEAINEPLLGTLEDWVAMYELHGPVSEED
jgi:hypothetical protein